MKDYLIVVDANYPGRARELVSEISQLSPKPVRFVFDTHAHRDHAYGNIVWTQAGATTFAYQGVDDEMDRYEPARWLATAAEREDVRSLNSRTRRARSSSFAQAPSSSKTPRAKCSFSFSAGRTPAATASSGFPKSASSAPATQPSTARATSCGTPTSRTGRACFRRPSPFTRFMFFPATETQEAPRFSLARNSFLRICIPSSGSKLLPAKLPARSLLRFPRATATGSRAT